MTKVISRCPAGLGICIFAPIAFVLPIWLAVYLLPSGSVENTAESGAKTVTEVIALFKQYDFDPESSLATNEPRLPPVFLSELPADLGKLGDLDRRKSVFVAIVLPHILRENRRILSERLHLRRLHRAIAAERTLRFRDHRWLAKRAKTYRTRPMDTEELLRRIDIVPPLLAVAQAALEYGWGTSRFAQAGNALFGQHAPVGEGTIQATGDGSVALRAFDNLQGSVSGYMRNLNRNRAYRAFRAMRERMRVNEDPLDATQLAAALGSYSEEGRLYIERLLGLMDLPEIAPAKNADFLN